MLTCNYICFTFTSQSSLIPLKFNDKVKILVLIPFSWSIFREIIALQKVIFRQHNSGYNVASKPFSRVSVYLVTRRGTMPSNMLSFDDRKFLLAVERGDVASTRRYVKKLIWKRIFSFKIVLHISGVDRVKPKEWYWT